MEPDSIPQSSQIRKALRHRRSKHKRKKRLVVLIIAAGVSLFGTLAYLDRNPDPTTWESMRTDYKNTK
ncbi:MAG: hypothetical protein QMC23_10830 [Rubritalea sp.]|jgi:uncharacterized membrane protein